MQLRRGCRFCGQNDLMYEWSRVAGDPVLRHKIYCRVCKARGPQGSTKVEARLLWETDITDHEFIHVPSQGKPLCQSSGVYFAVNFSQVTCKLCLNELAGRPELMQHLPTDTPMSKD